MRSRFVFFMVILLVPFIQAQTYWGEQVVESTITRYTPSGLGAWTYQRGFYLFGQYRMWKLTGNNEYFQYIRDWVNLHVDAGGNINQTINSLDNSEPALIDLLVYNETGLEKYKLAADYVRDIYRTYPKTSDGGFWHGMSMNGQLWLDGVYMSTPFLAHYAHTFGDTVLFTEVTDQIIVYASHLQDTSGLMFHAYDEDGSSSWATSSGNHSPHFWGRSMGWFGMAIVEILEVLPETHHKRAVLIDILSRLIDGLSRVQDSETGLWYQVPDQGGDARNWLESSCSSMYSYFTARAIEKGYVDTSYIQMAVNAYKGVIQHKIYFSSDNLINLKDICEGTGVSSDVTYYFNRARNTNDLHGLGAFLMMCWQMAQMGELVNLNEPPYVQIISPADSSTAWPGTDLDIKIQALDVDGLITRVDIFQNDQLLTSLSETPWEYTWQNIPEGNHSLKAVAFDDDGKVDTSTVITIISTTDLMITEAENGALSSGTIDTEHAGYSGAGYVNFTNESGSYLNLPVTVPESGQWQMRIRFTNGSTANRPCKIHWDNATVTESFDFPSTAEWTNWSFSSPLILSLSAGNHILRITGIESTGGPNVDYVEWIFLGGDLPPSVEIISPSDSTFFPAGNDLTIQIEATDNDGEVVQVDIYANDVSIASLTESPWQYIWEDVPAGIHQLKAIAHDDTGLETTSQVITLFASSEIIFIEAETGTPSSGTIDTEHAGFSGAGYVNLENIAGTWLDLPVNVTASGQWNFQLKYANGSAENRFCEIQWDGEAIVDSLDFPSTTDWTEWHFSSVFHLETNIGNHIMRITGLTAGSAPNLDYLQMNRIPETGVDKIIPIYHLETLQLYSAYPNPFNPQTTLSYSIPQDGHVEFKMINIKGECVDILINQKQSAGTYHIQWHPENKNLSSGIYFTVLKCNHEIKVNKLMFVQ